MKPMTGFSEPHTDFKGWQEIHDRVVADYPYKITIATPEKKRRELYGMYNFREELLEWVEASTLCDDYQWHSDYEGNFTFYFKHKGFTALFKLRWF